MGSPDSDPGMFMHRTGEAVERSMAPNQRVAMAALSGCSVSGHGDFFLTMCLQLKIFAYFCGTGRKLSGDV